MLSGPGFRASQGKTTSCGQTLRDLRIRVRWLAECYLLVEKNRV